MNDMTTEVKPNSDNFSDEILINSRAYLKDDLIVIYNDSTEDLFFITKQLAEKFGYSDVQTLTRILDVDETRVASYATLSKIKDLRSLFGDFNPRGMSLISEDGSYHAAFKSNKPEVKKFRKLVTSVILPSIRKTGSYSTVDNSNTKLLQDILLKLDSKEQEFQKQLIALEHRIINELKVEVEFKDYGVKTPQSCFDIDEYVSNFNRKYNKLVTKFDVHTLLRNYDFINRKNTMPTEKGIESGVVGTELFLIQYTNGSVGKSIKLVIYKKIIDYMDDALLNYIKPLSF